MADAAFIVHFEQSLARHANIVRGRRSTAGHRHRSQRRAVGGQGRGEDATRGSRPASHGRSMSVIRSIQAPKDRSCYAFEHAVVVTPATLAVATPAPWSMSGIISGRNSGGSCRSASMMRIGSRRQSVSPVVGAS